jgi:hypothetical protein
MAGGYAPNSLVIHNLRVYSQSVAPLNVENSERGQLQVYLLEAVLSKHSEPYLHNFEIALSRAINESNWKEALLGLQGQAAQLTLDAIQRVSILFTLT